MQEWLPLIAALIGALATFGIWAYASRQRLVRRAADLERALERLDRASKLEPNSGEVASNRGRVLERVRQRQREPAGLDLRGVFVGSDGAPRHFS